ncbi:MAG: hypothetical protein ACTSP3_01695 [Candidatus Heimdallarchaeaceae archaeon]
MNLTNIPIPISILKEAKKILGSLYIYLEEFISNYKARPHTPVWDIISFLVYLKIKNQKELQEKWICFWKKNSKKYQYRNLTYLIPNSYLQLADYNKTTKFFLKFLDDLKEDRQKIEWPIFLSIFYNFAETIRPRLKKKKFLVFLKILEKQTTINKELNKELGLNPSNLSKYKRNLIDRNIIFEGVQLNHKSLHLSVYGILYEYPLKLKVNFVKSYPQSIFLHSIHLDDIGFKTALVYYVTPDHYTVAEDLRKIAQKFAFMNQMENFEIYKFITNTRMKSFNYHLYFFKKGCWNLSFQDIKLSLFGYKSLNFEVPIIKMNFPDNDSKKLVLTKDGIEILNYILKNKHVPTRHLQKEFQIPEKSLKKALKSIRNQNLYVIKYNPSYIFGLTSIVMFLDVNTTEQENLHKKLSFFPEVYSEQFEKKDKKGLYFIIRVPNEILINTISVLSDFFSKEIIRIFIVNQMYSKKYLLPKERYETVFQEWKYKSQDILEGI